MAESHLQLNADGTTATRKTTLWPGSKPLQQEIIKSIFEQENWHVTSINNINGSHWKIETECGDFSWKVNLFISSIRDESRQPDEFKMQLGNTYPEREEEGWVNLVLGIYTVDDGVRPVEYILSGYAIDRYDFSSNPSIRGTRTSGLQKAKVFGMFATDKSVLFRPEFLYYYIETQVGKQLQEGIENIEDHNEEKQFSRQQIYYGAPGTGKSYKINEITKSTKNFTRTTFHPDSDYSTFVGCYKPTMEPTGTIVGGKEQTKISYSYVAQAFLQAYTAAWKNTSEPYYLIIEEINRGNCAQIFGDLFQLLDRDENGMSSYGITPDKDIANYLKKEFAKSEIENADIKNGNTMMLPSNLYIVATMNTSDQSLFPIDSAFKRRWDWEYVPIEDAGKKHYIKVGNKKYDWWTFIDTINNSIDHITGSEDKKMGYWFVKPQNNDREITAKQFVGKVLFYLWNDVYKDYFDMSQCIFKIKNEDGTDEKKPFTYFFGSEADKRIQAFMAYNKIPFITIEDNVDVEDDDDNEDNDGEEATDTETQMKQRNLWTLFNQIMKSKGRNEASREAQGKSKYDIRFKTTGMFIRNTVHVVGNSTTPASVYSEIHFKPTAQNLYEVIESKKDELQELFELPIVWRNPNGTHVGKIERQVNFNDENDKEAGMTWLAETSAKLYDYLKPIVDENK